MTDSAKILSQTNPSATTLTDSYTVPAATSTVVSSIIVANRSVTATTFRISIAVAGAADNSKQYIYYDVQAPGNDTFVSTIGLTLATTDVVRVYTTLATCSFTLVGIEIT